MHTGVNIICYSRSIIISTYSVIVLTIGRAKIAAMPAKAVSLRIIVRNTARIMTPIVVKTVSPAITEFSMMSYDKI